MANTDRLVLALVSLIVLLAVAESRHMVKRQTGFNNNGNPNNNFNNNNPNNNNPNNNPNNNFNNNNPNNPNNPNNNFNNNNPNGRNNINNNNRNQNNQCGGSGGRQLYVDPNDCSRFYECDQDGNAILKSCGTGTVFNDATSRCDWAANVQGSNCRMPVLSNSKPDLAQACATNPNGNNSQAFITAHPTLCNAFYICQPGFAHDPCVFCGEGTYFPEGGNGCMHNVGTDPTAYCGNKRFVAHRDIPSEMTRRECSSMTSGGLADRFQNNPNNNNNNNNNNNINNRRTTFPRTFTQPYTQPNPYYQG